MALLVVTPVSRAGVVPATDPNAVTPDAVSDKLPNTGKEFVFVKNGSGGPINVTAVTTIQVDGQNVADLVVAVADGASALIGPFPPGIYSDANDQVDIACSANTSVILLALSLTQGV